MGGEVFLGVLRGPLRLWCNGLVLASFLLSSFPPETMGSKECINIYISIGMGCIRHNHTSIGALISRAKVGYSRSRI